MSLFDWFGHWLDQHAPPARDTVLIIEDDEQTRQLLECGVRSAGLDVLSTGRVEEGIVLHRQHLDAISMVLVSERMPGLENEKVLEAIRGNDHAVRCCVMTHADGTTKNWFQKKVLGQRCTGLV
jgi:DNA-binding NtrC family response regulator